MGWMIIYSACLEVIFNSAYLPVISYDYSYIFSRSGYYKWKYENMIRKYPLFATILKCCERKPDTYCFRTNLYPIYVIATKYMDICGLFFCKIEYVY